MNLTSLKEVETFLYNLPTQLRDYEGRLRHVESVLTSLGSPQNAAPAIHTAGTSGKGSTSYYATSLLAHDGYSVGLIVSPHVHTVKERAQINGEPLSDEVYLCYFNEFLDIASDIELTYIEFLVVFAFWLFAQLKVDYIVVEVGMGGRLDPTNVLTNPNTVRGITDIGFDHMEFLGKTLTSIATEKAGIIHASDIVVMNSQPEEVVSTIKQKTQDVGAQFKILNESTDTSLESLALYQQRNWQLAHALISSRLKIDGQPPLSKVAITASLNTPIPGRFEQKLINETEVILDAAHNPQKITALLESLKVYEPNKKPVIVVAFGANKADSAEESLSLLEGVASHIIVTEFHLDFSGNHEAIEAKAIANLSQNQNLLTIEPQLHAALENALAYAEEHDTYVVITGSFYLLDNTYPLLKDFGKSE